MPSAAITRYFDATAQRPIRQDLRFAVSLVQGPRIAVDCGCGAGADLAFLADEGFQVYGFDVEEEAIARCTERFKDCNQVQLTRASFTTFMFPPASLVVADASLFFCPLPEFPDVLRRMLDCLYPGGIFCGSFLGPDDTMAGPDYKPDDYWPHVAAFEESAVRRLFAAFDILRFNTHRSSGTTPSGEPHDWHIHTVVARKP